jgi:hypothetical protein
MRLKKLLLTALVAFLVASLVAVALRDLLPVPEQRAAGAHLPDALVVFCFHGKAPTAKCEKIERYTRQVLEKSFAAPLKNGKLVWRVRNFEAPENAHFVDEYQITASCVVLVDARSNRPYVAKNLQKRIDQLVDDKEAFMTFVRSEIQDLLKK